jgi:hypothetical protein
MLHEVRVMNNKRVWVKKMFMWMLHEVGEINSGTINLGYLRKWWFYTHYKSCTGWYVLGLLGCIRN